MLYATWNVNSLKARLPRVLEFLTAFRPDLLFLQETKVEASAFPTMDLAAAGYEAVHHSRGRWAGVAILAPTGTAFGEECAGLAGEPSIDEARWIEATVGGVRAVSVYVPNGREVGHPAFEDKLRFLEAAAERIRELSAAGPLVVAGDFNVCPDDRDVYDPAAFVGATHVTPQERARFAALLEAGTVDAYRQVDPDGVQFTWWDYRAGHFHKGLGLRIDALLMTPDLAGRLEDVAIARDFRKGAKPSDHAPLLARLSE